jgi:hypothetical protein
LPNDTTNYNKPTKGQINAGAKQPDIQTNNDLGVSITTINITDTQVQIRSIISGAVSNTGTCTITLTNNGIEVIKTSRTYAMPSNSTCKGFDINNNELSTGTWQFKLSVVVDNKQSSITDSFSLE